MLKEAEKSKLMLEAYKKQIKKMESDVKHQQQRIKLEKQHMKFFKENSSLRYEIKEWILTEKEFGYKKASELRTDIIRNYEKEYPHIIDLLNCFQFIGKGVL